MKKVLLLNASHNDLGTMLALRKMGFYIIVTGNRPGLPAEKYADEYIQADYSDKDLILTIARNHKIDAICQCCNDFGVYTAAYVAELMGLPGYDSYETTLLLHNKDKFKQFSAVNNVLTPMAVSFNKLSDALSWLKSNISYPIIVKPTDASAGNGILRVDNYEQGKLAIYTAFDKSRSKCIVIEPFLTGSQHGFCTFLINRKVVAICSNNEYSIVNPYRVELDTFPSTTYDQSVSILVEQIEKIASLLQLKDGIFHLQYIYTNGKPYILEVMRRVLGNMYSVPGNQLTGIDWNYWEARARVGLDISEFPAIVNQEGFYAYKTLLGNRNGCIIDVRVSEQLKKYMYNEYHLWQPGYEITHWDTEPLGFIFLIFKSQDEMREVLIDQYGGVEVLYDE